MKRVKIICLLTLSVVFFTSFFFTLNTMAYPGEGNCSDYHGISYIKVPIDPDAEIIVDGVPSEEFWINNAVPTEIKLAKIEAEGVIPEIISLNISFVMNDEYLMVLCQWQDNTPGFDYPPEQDGIAFCWDINTIAFSAYYVSDMNTLHMGNGSVDAWRWIYQDTISPGEDHLCGDDCFNEEGWIQGNPEAKNIVVAYTYNSNCYTLEMKRPKVTNEIYDVQFNEKKLYKFNIATLNDTHDEGHAISWTYALDLREPEQIIQGYNLGLLLFSTSITVCLISIIKFKKKFHF